MGENVGYRTLNRTQKVINIRPVENFPGKNFARRKKIRMICPHFYYIFPLCPDISLCLPLMGNLWGFIYWYTLIGVAWCFSIIVKHYID